MKAHLAYEKSAIGVKSARRGFFWRAKTAAAGPNKHALKLPHRKGTVRELAIEALKIAGQALARRNRLNGNGASEAVFIEPLSEFAEADQTPVERKLELFHNVWKGQSTCCSRNSRTSSA
jgi:gamma-glutamylcysteine synthetase